MTCVLTGSSRGGLVVASGIPAHARRRQRQPPGASHRPDQPPPRSRPPPPAKPADPQDPSYKETVVVSASKTEQQLVDAPATMTVIGARAARGRAVEQLRATCCATCRA